MRLLRSQESGMSDEEKAERQAHLDLHCIYVYGNTRCLSKTCTVARHGLKEETIGAL